MPRSIIVKKSKIQGKGVFAARDFRKGEVILKWNPLPLAPSQFRALPGPEKRYVDKCRGKLFLMQPPERFVNHSCSPNSFVKNFCDVAKRGIKKGEEVTSDYELTAVCGQVAACRCGSRNCRGRVRV